MMVVPLEWIAPAGAYADSSRLARRARRSTTCAGPDHTVSCVRAGLSAIGETAFIQIFSFPLRRGHISRHHDTDTTASSSYSLLALSRQLS